jgi:AcrR family transcriptional regulator
MAKTTSAIWKRKAEKLSDQEIAMAERRADRREAQEQKILSVAARLFWENGFLGTSIDEIAKKTNMNKASIYYYFENKAVLLYEVVTRPLQGMIDAAVPIANEETPALERLKVLVETHIKYQLNHLGMTGIGHIERKNLPSDLAKEYVAMRDQYEMLFRKVISQGIEKNEFRFADAKLGALFTLGLLTSVIQWYKPKGRYSIEEVSSLACDYILAAILGTDKKM